MTNWNYADVWETVAEMQPDAPAIVQGSRHLNWRTFDEGADGIARYLLDLGLVQQDKVAIYLYNCPEYLQTAFATMKVGLVPVNTNYRYGDDELSYLWTNADAVRRGIPRCVHRTDRAHSRSGAQRARRGSGSTMPPGPAPTGPRPIPKPPRLDVQPRHASPPRGDAVATTSS